LALTAVFIAALATAALACSPHRVTHDPAPPLAVPTSYSAGSGAAAMPEQWWLDFNDPGLSALIAQTLEGNFQLRAAWARVRQARALVVQANSGKYPQIDVTASVARQKTRFQLQDMEFVQQSNQFSASIGAAYEVDLWRRMASTGDAAALDALAMRDDVESIAITLAAEVAEAWFDLVAQRAQHKLISAQIETNETYLELVRLRFEKGLASALDVFQQRQQLVSTRAQLELIESAIELIEHRLAVLAGAPPQGFAATAGDTLPPPPAQVPGIGLPADLLERRPDVRAARRRVEAADYRVAVAVADRLPALRLRGSAGLQSTSLADFIASPLWSILASVTAPLFDGGRRAAEVERNRAVVEERLMGYGQVMLQAMVEVESALVQERRQLAYIAALQESVELSEATLREAQARYRQGLVDYLPVLAALQGLQRAELNLLLARRQLLSYRIQLCRALGGGWTQELVAPERQQP
jgi:NodT family efflux transporter outer membrane factor (OMF) lipoprotein